MGKRADISSTLLNTQGGDLQDLAESVVTLTDDSTLTGRLDTSGGILSGDAKLLAAGTGHVLTGADAGKTVVFTAAAATTVKLPAPELGMVFNFVTAVTATADHVIQAATDDHGFLGGVLFTNTTADQTNAFAAATDGNNDFITMNGSTSGGHAGSHWRIVAILDASAAKCWVAAGTTIGSGAAVTPFGDAQI
jgi:hypothetical protein